MTYFHTGIRTIIGAKSFHGPVRDGKAWGQLAMVARRNWLSYDCIATVIARIGKKQGAAADSRRATPLNIQYFSLRVDLSRIHLNSRVQVIGSSLTGN